MYPLSRLHMYHLKYIYTETNKTLCVQPSQLRELTRRYIMNISGNCSNKTIAGATTNLTDIFTRSELTWARLITYYRIIGVTHIEVCVDSTFSDGTTKHCMASDAVHPPEKATRLVTRSGNDSLTLVSISSQLYDGDDIEDKIRAWYTTHGITPKLINSRTAYTLLAYTKNMITWKLFVRKLLILGVVCAQLRITITVRGQKVTHKLDILEQP